MSTHGWLEVSVLFLTKNDRGVPSLFFITSCADHLPLRLEMIISGQVGDGRGTGFKEVSPLPAGGL